jgi:hypothetical protein
VGWNASSMTARKGKMDDFNKLLNERVHKLLEEGDFIDSQTHCNYCTLLYSLKKDFIELLYDKSTGNILWVGVANDYDLKKYLDKIEINLLTD